MIFSTSSTFRFATAARARPATEVETKRTKVEKFIGDCVRHFHYDWRQQPSRDGSVSKKQVIQTQYSYTECITLASFTFNRICRTLVIDSESPFGD